MDLNNKRINKNRNQRNTEHKFFFVTNNANPSNTSKKKVVTILNSNDW